MKKFFLLISIFLVVTAAGCTHNLDTTGTNTDKEASPVSDFEYKENEEGGITIINYAGSEKNVIIPSKIEDKPVTQIGFPAFYQKQTILSVEIPNSVTLIEKSAFEGCISLAKVSLSQSLKSIGDSAFQDCLKLEAVVLPENLTHLGNQAFTKCTSLKHINIPKGIIEISEGTFYQAGIETVAWEEGTEKVGPGAFTGTNLRTVTLPKSIKEIADRAFSNCANLETVVLNEGLITIENLAFSDELNLTEIIIPASVTQISELAFYKCIALQEVKFQGNAPEEYQYDGTPVKGNYTNYYHNGATGFTSPKWCGYPTEIW